MRIRDLGVLAMLALPALAFALPVAADDMPRPDAPAGAPKAEVEVDANTHLLSFPEGNARLHVTRDMTTGSLVFRAAEGTTIAKAPVITLRTATGPKEVVLTATSADKTSWRVSHELLKQEKFDGTVAIMVGDRTLTTPLVLEPMRVQRRGGQILRLTDCGKSVEIVQDVATGSITVHAVDPITLTDPVLVISEPKDAGEIKFVSVSGQPGTWRATHATLKTVNLDGTFRVTIDGKVCTAPMVFVGPHGGRIVRVTNGPRFEVVQDPKSGYVFYALDETIDGKAVVIENPKVIWTTTEGPRTVALVPVENQPRAWRWAGIDGSVREPADARLSFTLFGRTLETGLGLTGAGVTVR
jgi:hypothetical protein